MPQIPLYKHEYRENKPDFEHKVNFVAAAGEQMVLSYATHPYNGFTYYEAYFKGGAHDGARGWVASDFLAHTQLRPAATTQRPAIKCF